MSDKRDEKADGAPSVTTEEAIDRLRREIIGWLMVLIAPIYVSAMALFAIAMKL